MEFCTLARLTLIALFLGVGGYIGSIIGAAAGAVGGFAIFNFIVRGFLLSEC